MTGNEFLEQEEAKCLTDYFNAMAELCATRNQKIPQELKDRIKEISARAKSLGITQDKLNEALRINLKAGC